MRLISFLIAAAFPLAVFAKEPPANNTTGTEQYRLFDGSLFMKLPQNLQKVEEYQHFWDQCDGGGYTVFFTGAERADRGMKLQVNIHDRRTQPKHLSSWYNPDEHELENGYILQDTVYQHNGKQYRSFATMYKGNNPLCKKNKKTWNYNLSYYIEADGHTLEFHYFYWDNKHADMEYWQQTANDIARSMQWQSKAWVRK